MTAWEDVPESNTLDELSVEELEVYLADIYHEMAEAAWVRGRHDRNGYLACDAGSAQCAALGHVRDSEGMWDEGHQPSYEGDLLCDATAYGTSCTECESAYCDSQVYLNMSTRAEFWGLIARSGDKRA